MLYVTNLSKKKRKMLYVTTYNSNLYVRIINMYN